ncbi:hypothetical protein FDP41_011379 [Naegleria fowleri]|uniref:Peptidase M24 domain-containing protein n=1 Tax=Naegleria fowleri TaxID=5763 RepID=A0A6A5CB13_NAEFO|nr:uncharacterized protein FDP41_011379 [Naegleria fowleri]KAF0982449.1 hypothetical protein FDP41_011379 [Naegleria fowleri]
MFLSSISHNNDLTTTTTTTTVIPVLCKRRLVSFLLFSIHTILLILLFTPTTTATPTTQSREAITISRSSFREDFRSFSSIIHSHSTISTTTTTVNLTPSQKLDQLRTLMKQYSIWAYIIPSSDSHMSEYVASSDQRRAFISGFDGSAGTALVTLDGALLWTDGRYWQQAQNQLDFRYWKLMKDGVDVSITTWLSLNVIGNESVGLDPFLYSVNQFKELQNTHVNIKLIYQNLVDLIWTSRPSPPNGKIFELDLKFSGRSASDKFFSIRKSMQSSKVAIYIVTALDEIAWFLNLRGDDIEYNTVFFSYLIVTMKNVYLFVDEKKFENSNLSLHLESLGVIIQPYSSYLDSLIDLINTLRQNQTLTTFIDPQFCNYATFSSIQSLSIIKTGNSFIRLEKAYKNEIEREGFKNCHLRDGAAVVRYLAWLEDALVHQKLDINEYEGAQRLEKFRAQGEYFLRPSFETISCYGENAAIIHYSPNVKVHSQISTSNVYLLDSGGQYLDGTTDMTRTVHFGIPNAHIKRSFTRVLQGHIALSSLIFPEGLSGDKMDAFARQALWSDGLNYNHGSGHGVGHCLDVHEGPHGIGVPVFGFMKTYDVTIEPGYYEEGNFGIRIENLYLVKESQTPHRFNNKTYLEFEQITFCPIQPSLIDTSLMSEKEIEWVNEYNRQVREKLEPLISQDTLAVNYLKRNTVSIAKEPNFAKTTLVVVLVMMGLILVVSIVTNIVLIIARKRQSSARPLTNTEIQPLSEELE